MLNFNQELIKIIQGITLSNLKVKLNGATFYNSLNHSVFDGETVFVGYGNDKKWFSVNLIENSDHLYFHTSMKLDKNNCVNYTDVSKNFYKFGPNLFDLGDISKGTKFFVGEIDKLLPYLK